jgi:pimeloyl-ACP methyl ester carboxylesterase
MTDSIKAPSAFLMAMEGRAPWEFGMALAAWPWLMRSPEGDGHGVVVFPGLAASDGSTVPLRAFLRGRGYDARGWLLRRNFGPRAGVLEQSLEQVRKLRRESGRPVSLVGWSLGGI